MGRNFGLEKAEQLDKDIKSAFTAGFCTGAGLASFGWIVIILATVYVLGAFH